ncbi:efflux RND transporter periplasmic adaptor subunit [bacterium]|nr:MAG: efflux RND transporter periplasmic adaptor subunit [bacterium]
MTIQNEKVDLTSLKINRQTNYSEEPSGNRKAKWFVIIGVLVVCAIGAWFLAPMFQSAKTVNVTTASLMLPGQTSGVLTASGYIVPQRKASVASKGTGRLVYLRVEEGDKVKHGQIIARLEDNDVQAQLAQANANWVAAKAQLEQTEADFEQAQKEYERNESFWKSKVITDSDFEIVKAQYKSAVARVNSAKANVVSFEAVINAAQVQIENTVIRAPFDGTVLTKNADVGEIVAPFAAGANSRGNVVTMADMASLQLEADVSESNIERVKIQQPCEITLDAFPEKRYRGEVWKIVPTADRAKATILTKIKFLEIDNKVLPEMSAKVTFLSEAVSDSQMNAKPKLTIPLSAIAERNGTQVVFIIKNDALTEKAILLGEKMGDRIEVVSGLSSGDKIVNSPAADLQSGDKVKAN